MHAAHPNEITHPISISDIYAYYTEASAWHSRTCPNKIKARAEYKITSPKFER
jgi:hypothetical protein